MLNLLNQTKLWMGASLLAAASIFAQQDKATSRPQKSFEQGHELSQSQLMAGYNAPASVDLHDSWDVYATASYLYWQAQQENLEIGIISRNNAEQTAGIGNPTPFKTTYPNNMSVTNPNFTYRPGFKFGLGAKLGRDGWDAFSEYTWFHGSIGTGVSPLPANTVISVAVATPNGEYLYPIQGQNLAESGENPYFFQDANQTWTLKMDFLDISMGRSYYSGTKLTLHPFFGARGAWIRQTLNTELVGSTNYNGSTNTLGYNQVELHNSTVSWGVGPRAGFESNWLLGYGVRLIGNGSADILYTRYETQINDQNFLISATTGSPIVQNAAVSQTIDYLRTHADLEMGFGWSSYFDNENWHVDLAATYGFQIFWDQNMFRNFESSDVPGKSFTPNGDLFVHGLTVNARLDF